MARFQETEQAASSLEQIITKLTTTVNELAASLVKLDSSTKTTATSQNDLKTKTTANKTATEQLTKAQKAEAEILRLATAKGKEEINAQVRLTEARRKAREEQKKGLGIQSQFTKGIKDGIKNFAAYAIGLTAIVGGIKSLITNTIKVSAEFQKYKAVLTTSLGSAREARIELNNLKELAAKTPFSINQLTESYVKLVNQGFRPTTKQMLSLGDLASSTGKEFNQLAEAILDAQTGEFERLKEFGIRAEKQGDQVKFTFKGVETQVKYSSAAIQDYIVGLGNAEGVSGSMSAISETLGGKISNLGDNWTQFLDTLGNKSGGIFTTVIGWMNSLVSGLNLATMSIQQIKEEAQDASLTEALIDDENEVKNLAKRYEDLGIKTGELTYEQYAANSVLEQYKSLLLSLSPEEEGRKANIIEQIKALTKLSNATVDVEKKTEAQIKNEQKLRDDKQKKLNKATIDNNKKLSDQMIKDNADAIEQNINLISSFTDDLEAEIDREINLELKSVTDNIDNMTEAEIKGYEDRIKALKEFNAKKKELNSEIDTAIQTIATDQFNANIDDKLNTFTEGEEAKQEVLKNQLDKGIISEAEYERKLKASKLKVRIEEAKSEKKKALFDIGVSTAMGVAKSLAEWGMPLALPFIAASVAIGAVQAAAVSAKPLPKYKQGTKGKVTSDHVGIIGDGGASELLTLPDGKAYLSPAKDTPVFLPRGSEVFSGADTKEILQNGGYEVNNGLVVKELQLTRKAIENQKGSATWTDKGLMYRGKINADRRIFVNKNMI